MTTFALKRIKIEGAQQKFYALVRNGKSLYDEAISEIKDHFHIPDDEILRNEGGTDELVELETLLERIALNRTVLPKCHKQLQSISQQTPFNVYEIRTRSSMIRLYCIKDKGLGKIIVLGHVKKDKKEQEKALKKVVRIAKKYYNFKQSNKVKIIE